MFMAFQRRPAFASFAGELVGFDVALLSPGSETFGQPFAARCVNRSTILASLSSRASSFPRGQGIHNHKVNKDCIGGVVTETQEPVGQVRPHVEDERSHRKTQGPKREHQQTKAACYWF